MSGKLYGSGQNYSGELGDGTTTSSTSIIQVGADIDWDLVSAGAYYSLGIKAGKLYASGE